MAMNRRGFLGRLLGKKPFDRACFALQLVIHADGVDGLRGQLHQLIDGPPEEDPAGKRRSYKELTGVLREAEPYFEYGSWTYEDKPQEARAEFHAWVSEIEADMATETREVGDEVDGYHRLDADKRYIVVTLVFLLTRPHPWADELDDEDEASYTRPRLAELLDSVNLLDFRDGVEGDATFLVPGSDADRFT